jgi:hypothetical protein
LSLVYAREIPPTAASRCWSAASQRPPASGNPPSKCPAKRAAELVDSLDGLGATGNGAHSPDEDLEIASIERATIRTAILLYRLTR